MVGGVEKRGVGRSDLRASGFKPHASWVRPADETVLSKTRAVRAEARAARELSRSNAVRHVGSREAPNPPPRGRCRRRLQRLGSRRLRAPQVRANKRGCPSRRKDVPGDAPPLLPLEVAPQWRPRVRPRWSREAAYLTPPTVGLLAVVGTLRRPNVTPGGNAPCGSGKSHRRRATYPSVGRCHHYAHSLPGQRDTNAPGGCQRPVLDFVVARVVPCSVSRRPEGAQDERGGRLRGLSVQQGSLARSEARRDRTLR